eukprot:jgi/Mesvir1/26626/Mv22262-RA.1
MKCVKAEGDSHEQQQAAGKQHTQPIFTPFGSGFADEAGRGDEVSELQVAAVRAELLLRIDQLGVERARVLVEKRKLELELEAHKEEVDVRRRRTAAGWRVEATDYRRQHLEKLAELQRTVEGNGTLRLNDRDRLFLQDKVNDALYSGMDAPREEAPPRKALDITTVAREMGYAVHCKEAALVGRSMAARFRERFPDVPIPKAEKFVDGAVRMVNCYWDTPEVRALMEGCIREFVEEAGKRPVQTRRA